MKKVLCPGSFDPITYGHMNVVDQALEIYDKVVIAVLINRNKKSGWFTIEERKQLIEQIYKDNPRVEVVCSDLAAVDVALNNGCKTMAIGLRDVTDYSYEKYKAEVNFVISEEKVNTIALFANPKNTTISSSLVKELFGLGKSISSFVHPLVEEAIKNKFKEDYL